ncbi:hypothetical protein [Streptomonospora litoralis]|uniref:Uncharacterized protein n=1 Tax=Streptomonospora litoralis TaxID=2498135 RepID=A0A4P6Q6P8_9ACTN|nr:hypothetical protein [Streptomonospora litoralis]QBI54594.1 hypothetical protein EKD16_14065 [Streptomonospora litoralis]
MIVGLIVACEALFWVLLLGGLAARYLLRRRRLSAVVLLMVPVLDAVLLAVIAAHLLSGGTADASHGLGALYLGFTVAYGHTIVGWADARFAHRFAGGPPPERPPKRGAAKLRHEAVGWARGTLACLLSAAALGGLILLVGDAERTEALRHSFAPLGIFMFWNTVIAVWGAAEAVMSPGASGGEGAGEAAPEGGGAWRR